MKKIYIQPQTAVFKTSLSEGVLTQGSLTSDHATFYQEDATGDGMTKYNDWNIWNE